MNPSLLVKFFLTRVGSMASPVFSPPNWFTRYGPRDDGWPHCSRRRHNPLSYNIRSDPLEQRNREFATLRHSRHNRQILLTRARRVASKRAKAATEKGSEL